MKNSALRLWERHTNNRNTTYTATMTTEWVPVFESPSAPEVQFIQGMLQEQEIPAVIINKSDSMHIHLNATLPMVTLHVSKTDVVKAKYFIEQHT